MLTAASTAYGFTEGGAWAERISLTPLGRAAVAPIDEGQDAAALVEAVMRPRVVREFLQRYNGSKWPRRDIACNVLVDLGVPSEQAERAFDMIYKNAAEAGLLMDIKGSEFVSLDAPSRSYGGDETPAPPSSGGDGAELAAAKLTASSVSTLGGDDSPAQRVVPPGDGLYEERPIPAAAQLRPRLNRRVFISHRSGDKVAEEIETLLKFGDLEPISHSSESGTELAPFDAMQTCGAGIFVIPGGGPVPIGTLLEIGAGIALFRSRLVVLSQEAVTLPTELVHLRRVPYSGSSLDHAATLGLMGVLVDFKRTDP